MTTPTPDTAQSSTTTTRARPAPATASHPDDGPDERRRREVLARARQLRATPRTTTARTAPAAPTPMAHSSSRPSTTNPSRQGTAWPRAGRQERGALQRWRERSYGHGEAPLRALLAAASEAAALTLAMTSPRPVSESAAKPEVPTGQPDDQATTRGRTPAARPSPRRDEEETDFAPRTQGHSRGPDRQQQL